MSLYQPFLLWEMMWSKGCGLCRLWSLGPGGAVKRLVDNNAHLSKHPLSSNLVHSYGNNKVEKAITLVDKLKYICLKYLDKLTKE